MPHNDFFPDNSLGPHLIRGRHTADHCRIALVSAWIASGFNQPKLELTFRLLLIVSPLIILSGIANIWGAVLNAGERFALVALAPIITPSVTVIVLLFVIRYSIVALRLAWFSCRA